MPARIGKSRAKVTHAWQQQSNQAEGGHARLSHGNASLLTEPPRAEGVQGTDLPRVCSTQAEGRWESLYTFLVDRAEAAS